MRDITGSAWPAGLVTEEDRARWAGYAEAQAFADGAQWSGKRRRGEIRLTMNYARTLSRKVASYVFPAPVRFTVTPEGEPAIANRAEQALAAAIATTGADALDLALCVEASVLGDAAVKVTWDAGRGRPAVTAVDPATLVARTAADDPRRLEAMAQGYWLAGAEVVRLFGGRAAGLDPSRRYQVTEEWTADRWRVEVAGQAIRDEANPYGWIPYVVLANDPRPHAFWGQSDLTDLTDVCRELNARLSVLSRVLELSGAPIAVLENVDGSEGITVGPGAKWELPEGAKAYLLDLLGGGGTGLHIAYVELLFRVLHDLAETPRTAFGDSGRALSGAALEVEIQPLVQRVRRKRAAWDGFYRERNARLLDLLERVDGAELGGLRRTETIWPPILPSDESAVVSREIGLVSAGIRSRRSALAALGELDPEAELARVAEERATALASE